MTAAVAAPIGRREAHLRRLVAIGSEIVSLVEIAAAGEAPLWSVYLGQVSIRGGNVAKTCRRLATAAAGDVALRMARDRLQAEDRADQREAKQRYKHAAETAAQLAAPPPVLPDRTAFRLVDLIGGAPKWQEEALCAQTDPEAFFPEKGGSTRDAKRICTRCPVRADCLEYALYHDERFGIWGGLSERERRKLKR